MKLDEVESLLHKDNLIQSISEYDKIKLFLSLEKETAKGKNQEDLCNKIWCIEQVLEIVTTYLKTFNTLKEGKFYDAWVLLENIELQVKFLKPHFENKFSQYGIDLISRQVEQFQSLYPYEVFFSPEILALRKRCNICNKEVLIRNPCGHKVGKLYQGEMCIRIVEEAKLLSIAAVKNPVQKYSVAFSIDPETGQSVDQYNYSRVKWVIERLQSPFDSWRTDWTKIRHPHDYFKDVNSADKCPCGSGKSYFMCCLKKSGVLRPHCNIFFENPDLNKSLAIDYDF